MNTIVLSKKGSVIGKPLLYQIIIINGLFFDIVVI
jgi:hypothetical protein